MTIRMLPQKIFQPIVSCSFLSLAKVGKCNALWSAAVAVSVVVLVSYFLGFNGITYWGSPGYAKTNFTNANLSFTLILMGCH